VSSTFAINSNEQPLTLTLSDSFHYALAKFSIEEWEAAGITAEDRYLIEYMADQEVGHATVIQNMLQGQGAQPCNYTYPFETVREFIDFSQKVHLLSLHSFISHLRFHQLTRWGESGVYGFLEHLDCRACGEILLQSITVEARQQMVFRQFEGLFPMPFWHTTAITQSMTWTLLAPYIKSCPATNPRIEWMNFPGLNITNNPDATPLAYSSVAGNSTFPAITRNRTEPLTAPGRELHLQWEEAGRDVGYNSSYTTNTTAGAPKFVAWISQLNVTYTELFDVNGTTGKTIQPGGGIFGNNSTPTVNGTIFVMVTDEDLYVTPFNTSYLNTHIVAGPAMYQSS
jgi:hypothetical protein